MDIVLMGMGTTKMHRKITKRIANQLLYLESHNKEVIKEDCDLTYYGKRSEGGYLVDISQIADVQNFVDNVITQLNTVNPDIMLISDEKIIYSKNGVRVAGFPDLVVEVWSDSNTPYEINFKKTLYSTAPTTEQWYINQDSPVFERYIGEEKLTALDLREIVHTKDGYAIDLRELFSE